MTQEALSSLKALSKQLRVRLLESPEFRALEIVDRTIQELSEILTAPAPPPPDAVAPPAPVDEAPMEAPPAPSSIPPQPKADMGAGVLGSSQSRMAKAIAATIAANSASSLSSETRPRFNHLLNVAS